MFFYAVLPYMFSKALVFGLAEPLI